MKERIRIRTDRGGFDIGATGAFALVGLLKVKFVSGGTRFMSRKFRETKPGSLEIFPRNRSKSKALKQARGLVMRDRRRAINKTSGGKWRDRALNGRWMYDGRMRKTQTPFAKTKLTPSKNGEKKNIKK